jgi:serine/threonine protein phosphatase PrpC
MKPSIPTVHVPIEIAALSLREPSKEKCGDSFRHAILESEKLAVLCIADGVSGAAYDWKASSIACDVFMSAFRADAASPMAQRIKDAVHAANDELTSQNMGKPRMLTSLVAAVWDWVKDEIHYTSIGDSRLYTASALGLKQITADEAVAVIIRGRDGKPILSAGSVAVGKGITNVIGVPELCLTVDVIPAKEIFAVVLATDGFFGSAAFSSDDMINIVEQVEPQKALAAREMLYRDAQSDDSTVVIARKNDFKVDNTELISGLLAQNRHYRESDIPAFVVAKEFIKRIEQSIEIHDRETCLAILNYARETKIDFGTTALKRMLDLLSFPAHSDRMVFDAVLDAMRKSKN